MMPLLGFFTYAIIATCIYLIIQKYGRNIFDIFESVLLSLVTAFALPLALLVIANNFFSIATNQPIIRLSVVALALGMTVVVWRSGAYSIITSLRGKKDIFHFIGIAASLALFLWSSMPYFSENTLWIDEAIDENVAVNILQTGQFEPTYHKEYEEKAFHRNQFMPFSLALFYAFFGASERVLYSVNIVFGLFAIMATYIIGKRFFSKTTGLIACLLLAATPLFRFYALRHLTEMSQIFVTGMAVYLFIIAFVEKKYGLMPLLALFSGLLIVSKISLGLVLIAMAVSFFIVEKKESLKELKKIVTFKKILFSSVIIFLLLSFSYLMNSYFASGSFLETAKFYIQANRHGGEGVMPFTYFLTLSPWLLGSLSSVMLLLLGSTLLYLTKDKKQLSVGYIFLISLILSSLAFKYKEDRYIIFLYCLIFPIVGYSVAYAIENVLSNATKGRSMKSIAFAAIAILVAISSFETALSNGDALIERKIPSYQGLKVSGPYIHNITGENEVVFSTSGVEHGYYIKRPTYFVRIDNIELFKQELEHYDVSVVALTMYEGPQLMQALQRLNKEPTAEPTNSIEYALTAKEFKIEKVFYEGETPVVIVLKRQK